LTRGSFGYLLVASLAFPNVTSNQPVRADNGPWHFVDSSVQPGGDQARTAIQAAHGNQASRIDCPKGTMKLMKEAAPYPSLAIRLGHEGRVILLLTFGSSGAPMDIQIDESSGFRELDKAAEDTARNWRITHAECIPEKGAVVRVPIDFDLHRQ
jgi:TonB family protein